MKAGAPVTGEPPLRRTERASPAQYRLLSFMPSNVIFRVATPAGGSTPALGSCSKLRARGRVKQSRNESVSKRMCAKKQRTQGELRLTELTHDRPTD